MIGIFDSGSGGLTVLRSIKERIPSADIVYVGDTAYAPYGNRSRAEISLRTMHAIQTLTARGATSIVSACNSVSASLAISLFDSLDIHPERLIEMVGPTVSSCKNSSARMLLVATDATVRSEIYQNGFRMIGKPIEALALPALAGAIENGASFEELEQIVREGFATVNFSDIDIVILACTHYPLAYEAFRAVLPKHVIILDPAEAVADRVERLWWPREVGNGTLTFLITKDSAPFRERVASLFPGVESTIEVIE